MRPLRLPVRSDWCAQVTVVADVGSASLTAQWQNEYRLLFNGYDEIRSTIDNINLTFAGQTAATARFSHLLTAVYKKDGRKKIVFEGTKSWHFRKPGNAWVLTGAD